MKAIISIEGKTYTQFPNLIQDDYGYNIEFNLQNNDGSAYNLVGFDEVRFKTKLYGATTLQIDRACSITNATSGIAVYTLQSSDLSVAGKFYTEIQTSSSSKIVSTKLGDLIVVEDL